MNKVSTTAIRLKEAMDARHMRASELSQIAGIGKSAISQYLSGKVTPKQDKIFALAQALDVNEAWLMGLDVPIEKNTTQFASDKANDAFDGAPNAIWRASHAVSQGAILTERIETLTEQKLKLLARHLEKVPDEQRKRMIDHFADSIDMYLDAMGIPKEDE